MYVITGGTGNTGKPIALAMLRAGKKVRIICRDAAKAKDLADAGAEICTGDASDADFLTTAFTGATAVYLMIPPDMKSENFTSYQMLQVKAMATALVNCNIKYEVTLSSVGAHLERNSGVILGMHYAEQTFNAIPGLNTLHLRPTYFIENTLGMAAMAKHMGIIGSPIKGDLSFPMIATKDIAAYAANRLAALDFSGHNIQYLLGKRDVSYKEVAALYGKAIGKPDLPYVEFSYSDMKTTMTGQWGASESVADMFVEFMRAMNEGRILSDAFRTEENTTQTPIEEFAQIFKQMYESA
ncbi:MAG: NmrA family NAD(P)-binding protein [Bacteroidales bacterium]